MNQSVWSKGELKRIYLSDAGYNTKKMSTKTYIFQRKEGTFGVSCVIDCPNQHDNWIQKEQDSIIESLTETIFSHIEENGLEVEVEEVIDNSPIVKGFYLQWREVRLYDGPYGRKRDTKKQYIIVFEEQSAQAPKSFIELNEEEFELAKTKDGSIVSEYLSDDDAPAYFSKMVERNKKWAILEEERKIESERIHKENEEKKAEREAEIKTKIKKMKEAGISNGLVQWAANGYIHPAPAEVIQEKEKSGLNWKKFTASINKMILTSN